ncbi:MAG TPA: hypothetical protein VFB37_00940 [Steroidobacteraceae bacterium]|nr:hypothetical protein [Steroidobacteraceae bacterium]
MTALQVLELIAAIGNASSALVKLIEALHAQGIDLSKPMQPEHQALADAAIDHMKKAMGG